jgi:hypothetical protein
VSGVVTPAPNEQACGPPTSPRRTSYDGTLLDLCFDILVLPSYLWTTFISDVVVWPKLPESLAAYTSLDDMFRTD